jgi:hypothetical protein
MNGSNITPEQSKKLQTLWADGTDLAVFFKRGQQDRELRPSLYDHPQYEGLGEHALGRLSLRLERMNREGWRAEEVIEDLRRELVAGRLSCIGRRFDNGAYSLELIPAAFWLGARIQASTSAAEDDCTSFDMVRIAGNAPPIEQGETQDVPVADVPQAKQELRKSGRPSRRLEIMDAINHFAKAADWFLAISPGDRHRAYLAHIRATTGINTTAVGGFDTKTLQKYESEYRRSAGK